MVFREARSSLYVVQIRVKFSSVAFGLDDCQRRLPIVMFSASKYTVNSYRLHYIRVDKAIGHMVVFVFYSRPCIKSLRRKTTEPCTRV